MKRGWLSVAVSCLGITTYLGIVDFGTKANYLLAQTPESQVAQASQDAALKIEEALELAHQSANKGLKTQSSELLFKALNLTKSIENNERKDELLIEIVTQLAEIGQDDQALAIATNQIKTINPKANALLLLTDLYRLTGKNDKALQILQIGKAMVLDKTLDFRRSGIVAKYAEIGQYDQALALAKTIESEYEKAEAGRAIAQVYFNAGQYDQAFKIAQILGVGTLAVPQVNVYPGPDLLVAIADKYIEAGQESLALEVTKAIPHTSYQISTLRAIARQYHSAGQKDKALDILSEALKIAKAWTPIVYDGPQTLEGSNAYVLAEIAGDYADLGQYDQAMQVVEAIGNKNYEVAHKAEALLKMARAYARAGQQEQAAEVLSKALGLSQSLQGKYQTAGLLPITAIGHAEAGQYDKALETTAAIADATQKAKTLLEIVSVQNRVGQKSQLTELLSQALQAAQTIDHYSLKIKTLGEIAQASRLAGQKEQTANALAQALQAARTIEDNYERSEALAQLANLYGTVGQQEQVPEILSQALKEVEAIASIEGKILALRHIADQYVAVGQKNQATQVLSQALQVAKTLPKASERTSKLTEIAQQQKNLNL